MKALNDVIILVTEGLGVRNENGFRENVILKQTEIFAEMESVKRSEYYEALRSGDYVSATFTVNLEDYNEGIVKQNDERYKPNKVVHEEIEYIIRRTYRKGNQYIELIVKEVE